MTTLSEIAVQANEGEAQRLYLRGVAAARAGQKRVAAGLLTRAVRLDPQGEMAWLWLSGVLDDPHQQAFCLRTVVKLNPQNQHALRGLRLLEARGLLKGEPPTTTSLSTPIASVAPVAPEDRARREAWWVGWRRSRREMSRARLLLWAFPIVLVCLSIVLYESFTFAIERSLVPPLPVAEVSASAAMPTPVAFPTVAAILEAEPLAVVESLTAGYLSALDPVRADLRAATDAYRQATNRATGGSVGAVAATQRLRTSVEAATTALADLHPPRTLQQAHDDYRKGLELEHQGLDAVLEFYSSYQVANANRAALHFQEARAYIERAQSAFATQSQQLADLSTISSQTAR